MYTEEECKKLADDISEKQGYVRVAVARREELDTAYNRAQDEYGDLKVQLASAENELRMDPENFDKRTKLGQVQANVDVAKRTRDGAEDAQTAAKKAESDLIDALGRLLGEQRVNC